MRRILQILAILVFSWGYRLHATHVAGAEIMYRYIGDSTNVPRQYLVIVKLYRLQSSPVSLATSVSLCVRSSCFSSLNVNLPKIPPAQLGYTPITSGPGSGGFLTPGQDECVSTAPGAGFQAIETHWYQGVVTLPQNCSDVRFSHSVVCCRNPNQNLVNAGSATLYVEALLNSMVANNTSPQFITPAAKSFCTNNYFVWSQATIEPNGDSIRYRWANPQQGNNCGPGVNMAWQPGYSVNQPFPIAPGTQIVIENNGSFKFTTGSTTGLFVLKVEVEEYKYDTIFLTWVLVGTSQRDMQVNFVNNCKPEVQNGPKIDINQPGFSNTSEPGGGYVHGFMSNYGYPLRNDSVPNPNSPTGWNKIIPIVPYNCFDSLVDLKFDVNIQCESITNEGSEFRIVGPDSILRPVIGVNKNCNVALETKHIQLRLHKPFTVNGDYILYIKQGNDGNTMLNSCGFPLPEYYAIIIRVNNCPNPLYDLKNVTIEKNQHPYLEWEIDSPTVNLAYVDGWNVYRSDDSGQTFNFLAFQNVPTDFFWRDITLNTPEVNSGIYHYKVQLVMTQPFYITRSIRSILLDTLYQTDSVIALVWNHYDGWPHPRYTIEMGVEDSATQQINWQKVEMTGNPTFDSTIVIKKPCDGSKNQDYWLRVVADDTSGINWKYKSISNYEKFSCKEKPVPPPPVYEPIEIPNVITPNGDGLNDAFVIKNIEQHRNARLRIMNRWGDIVFESNNYESATPWNGNHRNTGQPVADGVYFYVLQYLNMITNEIETRNGTISVFK
ncbi:MAG: gliding motility-associated C-terminal domain-containing protein [Thermaurantimonas sp.]|uniref:gliding motility-associated C-terminal domain-containing protein n=1 Tax=Thermaurantimonas sp. TaxID=2681568 RepID=UPI00391BC60E